MIIYEKDPIDLTGLTRRDMRDIEHSMENERQKLDALNMDSHTQECMMSAIYRALIICKKLNKEKYTPKKYKKLSAET